MSSKKNTFKGVESNLSFLTTKKKTQKSLKPKRKFMKKSSNDNSKPDESKSPLSTLKKETPKSLKPKGKIVKKSLNENSKFGESSSPPLKKKTPKPLKTESKIVRKSSNENSIALNSKETKKPQNPIKMPNEKSRHVHTKEAQKSQKSKPEAAKKGLNEVSGKAKEMKSLATVQSRNEDMKKLGGFIFMCNGKTKRDCYRYRVMGVQAHKKELVMGVKPGMKLFLYDFDLKILYGIYKASSAGGMKLEPAAFGGAFPLQVRFDVHKDCLPLPESVFKKAIKETYDERTRKFKTELTFDQVKKLTNLFKPAALLHSNPHPVVHEPHRPSEQESMQFLKPTVSSPSLLLTEQEYRSYGLRGDRHKNITSVAHSAYDPYRTDQPVVYEPYRPTEPESMQFLKPDVASPSLVLTEHEYRSYGLRGDRHKNIASVGHPAHDPYRTDQPIVHEPYRPTEPESMQFPKPSVASPLLLTEQEYRSYGLRGERYNLAPVGPPVVYDPYSTDQEREVAHPDTLFLSEKDYRTFGLKGRQENPTSITPNIDSANPSMGFYQSDPYSSYNQNSSTVDRYLSHAPAAPSSFYGYDATRVENDGRFHKETILPDRVERLYSVNASNALSEYNQGGGEPEYRSAPVSSRYVFAGPSVIYR